MSRSSIKVGIVGASGYSGEELVRLLLGHPQAELVAITSRQNAGQTLDRVFPRFAHHPVSRQLRFTEPRSDEMARAAEVVFLALPHGVAAEQARPLLEAGCRVIDLSADFRLRDPATYKFFYEHDHPAPDLLPTAVYGLPEHYRESIRPARLIASPGCYPTSVLLPVLPLVKAGLIQPENIIADSLSGFSGAGRKVDLAYLFVEGNESLRPYGVPRHRHLSEMEQEISTAAGRPILMQFTPHLVPVNRGILTTLYLTPHDDVKGPELGEKITACYHQAYDSEPFIRLLEGARLPDTKNVVGTNVLEMAWRLDARTGRVVVMSAIDNIVKGAGGQAVQSLNIACGFPETTGLM